MLKVFDAVKTQKPDLESEPWPLISTEAKAVISAMLHKDPRKRPTAEELLSMHLSPACSTPGLLTPALSNLVAPLPCAPVRAHPLLRLPHKATSCASLLHHNTVPCASCGITGV